MSFKFFKHKKNEGPEYLQGVLSRLQGCDDDVLYNNNIYKKNNNIIYNNNN